MLKNVQNNPAARWTAGLVPVLVLLGFFLQAGSNGPEHSPVQPAGKITIGVATNITSGLVYIAETKGYFKEEGLEVAIRDYSSGLNAMRDLVAARLDMATCADAVFVIESADRMDLRVFATIARADDHEILIRRGSGISAPADLRGKWIAVTLKTSSHFFLETFLSFYGIQAGEVHIVDLSPLEMLKWMREGKVDAACTWEPNAERIKDALGSGAFSWPAQKGRNYNWLVVAGNEFLKANGPAVSRFLKALLAAEAYAQYSPQSARDIVAGRLLLTDPGVRSAWPKFDFRVTLDQDLINIMEDEARWAMGLGLIRRQETPNYFSMIDLEPLETIDPGAVGVIH